MPDFPTFLDHLRAGLAEDDAAALVDVLPEDLDAWLATVPDARRQMAKAQAEFRLRMTRVLVDCAEVTRSVTAARHFLQRPVRSKQLELDFAGKATVVLDLPDNGR